MSQKPLGLSQLTLFWLFYHPLEETLSSPVEEKWGQKESRGGGREEEAAAEGKAELRFCLDGILADPREF